MDPIKYKHVDDWLDAPTTDERELPAKMWFEKFRAPAHKKDDAWLAAHVLLCTYQDTPNRVVGCSRLGDVWLSVDLEDASDRDYRVDIRDCSKWSMRMADGTAHDIDGPWRVTRDRNVTGNFIPTIVDCCNRPLWSAHAAPGIYERIVKEHNDALVPFVSEWESLDADDEIPADAYLHDDPLHDRRIAHSEGWDLFDIDTTGILEIQRDDEAGKFSDDQAAVDFVKQRNTPYHQKAFAIHKTHSADAARHRRADNLTRDRYSTTTKQLLVVGRMWGGGKGSHTYDVSLRAVMDIPTTLRGANLLAGDFESLESATLVTTEREIDETITRTPLT